MVLNVGWWWILALAVFAFLVAYEIGFKIARRWAAHANPETKSTVAVMAGAILGLVGLLLAFSFGVVESRFMNRKRLVLDEANAIGTTYLRTWTIPDERAQVVRSLLKDYVDTRLAVTEPEHLAAAIRRSGELHVELWAEATGFTRRHPGSPIVALFLASLNEVIDLHESRVTVALHQRLPLAIFRTLCISAFLGFVLLGYDAGMSGSRTLVGSAALVVTVASVLVLIIELDRPHAHLFHVNQQATADVRQSMEEADRGLTPFDRPS